MRAQEMFRAMVEAPRAKAAGAGDSSVAAGRAGRAGGASGAGGASTTEGSPDVAAGAIPVVGLREVDEVRDGQKWR